MTGDCDLEKWQTKEKLTVNSLVFEKASEWIFSISYKLNHTTLRRLRPNKEKFSVELFQNLPHQTSSQKLTLQYFAVPPFLWWLQIRRSLLILFFISMKVCGFLMCFATTLIQLIIDPLFWSERHFPSFQVQIPLFAAMEVKRAEGYLLYLRIILLLRNTAKNTWFICISPKGLFTSYFEKILAFWPPTPTLWNLLWYKPFFINLGRG